MVALRESTIVLALLTIEPVMLSILVWAGTGELITDRSTRAVATVSPERLSVLWTTCPRRFGSLVLLTLILRLLCVITIVLVVLTTLVRPLTVLSCLTPVISVVREFVVLVSVCALRTLVVEW